MKRKASISHNEAIVRELKENPEFAEEYLKAALEDCDEPKVLLVAWGIWQKPGAASPKSQNWRASNGRACTALSRPAATHGCRRSSPSPRQSG